MQVDLFLDQNMFNSTIFDIFYLFIYNLSIIHSMKLIGISYSACVIAQIQGKDISEGEQVATSFE